MCVSLSTPSKPKLQELRDRLVETERQWHINGHTDQDGTNWHGLMKDAAHSYRRSLRYAFDAKQQRIIDAHEDSTLDQLTALRSRRDMADERCKEIHALPYEERPRCKEVESKIAAEFLRREYTLARMFYRAKPLRRPQRKQDKRHAAADNFARMCE